ncbi:uncharacterized protein BKA78DRAFT_309828 [Phyllosticta capitalensis]|uniref:uncharacterized protein n=1 Tax=Phyllosticta capitalensis TaxID=121624 RepID=UPI00312F2676
MSLQSFDERPAKKRRFFDEDEPSPTHQPSDCQPTANKRARPNMASTPVEIPRRVFKIWYKHWQETPKLGLLRVSDAFFLIEEAGGELVLASEACWTIVVAFREGLTNPIDTSKPEWNDLVMTEVTD